LAGVSKWQKEKRRCLGISEKSDVQSDFSAHGSKNQNLHP